MTEVPLDLVCAHVLDLSFVFFHQLVDLERLVDIERLRHCELRELEVVLVMDRTTVNNKVIFK